MKEAKEIRSVLFTDEFQEFRDSFDNRIQKKIDDCVYILKTF
jgi:hypothetical protein